jgi:ankyrin repeat protein
MRQIILLLFTFIPAIAGAVQPSKDFRYIDVISGKTNNFMQVKGKVIIVNLFATWCPPCRQELPILNRIAVEYSEYVIVIAGALDNVTEDVLKDYAKNRGLTIPVFFAEKADSKWWDNPSAIPLTYIIGTNFQVAETVYGAKSYETYAELLKKVLPKKTVNILSPLDSSLLHAAKFGNYEELQEFIKQGAKITAMDDSTNTPLHRAAAYGHLKIVQYLVELGADIHQKACYGATPLLEACKYGKTDVVKYLISAGSDVNTEDVYGASALHWAAMGGYSEIIDSLIGAGAKVNAEDEFYRTPLHYSAYSGEIDALQLLLKKGADLNMRDSGGNTPFMYAKDQNKKEVIEYLSSIGAP